VSHPPDHFLNAEVGADDLREAILALGSQVVMDSPEWQPTHSGAVQVGCCWA
jgi:hypothetical protein